MTDITGSLIKAHSEARAQLKGIRGAIREAKREQLLLTQEIATLRQACNEVRERLYRLHGLTPNFLPPRAIN
jgi:hypothetical protein